MLLGGSVRHYDSEFDATVLGSASGGIVSRNGLYCAEAFCFEAIGRDTQLNQRLAHGAGARFAQRQVGAGIADRIRMPRDDNDARALLVCLGQLHQQRPAGGIDDCAAYGKFDPRLSHDFGESLFTRFGLALHRRHNGNRGGGGELPANTNSAGLGSELGAAGGLSRCSQRRIADP